MTKLVTTVLRLINAGIGGAKKMTITTFYESKKKLEDEFVDRRSTETEMS